MCMGIMTTRWVPQPPTPRVSAVQRLILPW